MMFIVKSRGSKTDPTKCSLFRVEIVKLFYIRCYWNYIPKTGLLVII